MIDGIRPRDQMVTDARLHGNPQPEYGRLVEAVGWSPAVGPGGQAASAVETNGTDGRLKYQLVAFPEADYTAALWLQLREYPRTRLGQVISAWTAGMDDPLRLVIEGRQLFARIEAQQAYGTEGTPLQLQTWYHVAVVRVSSSGTLRLYVDAELQYSKTGVSGAEATPSHFMLGGSHINSERFEGSLDDLRFYGCALAKSQIRAVMDETCPPDKK